MKTIDEKSKAIADFMAVRKNEDGTYEFPEFGFLKTNGRFMTRFFPERFKYHCSFDWLMPVVRKLKKINSESKHGLFEKPTDNLNCQMMYEEVEDCLCDLSVENAYNAVCAMIYWLTKNNRYEEAKSKDC